MFNALRDAALPDTLRVHRAEIAHRGKLGLLSIEGVGRNPRIDDLQTLIYDPAIEDDAIAAWLEEVKSTREDRVGSGGLEDVQVGLSCSSATMRLADEVVSFHAAAATRRLRPYLAKDGPARTDGLVNLSFLSEEGDSRASVRTVGATVVLGADYGWQIRIPSADEIPSHAVEVRPHSMFSLCSRKEWQQIDPQAGACRTEKRWKSWPGSLQSARTRRLPPRPARRLRCGLRVGTPSYGTLAPTPTSPTRLSGRSVSHRSRSTYCGSPAAGAVGFPTMLHVAEATLNYSEVREALVERYQSVPVDWIRYGKHSGARWSSID
ncbi:hypothetical protein JQ595_17920 [Bradyrhizobium japonicum]|uniref:hypothetical protein n=1 Tax=Bradyrhizobium japonicum TaxID=375 RepID=UPI001BA93B76|nr:hypothetical protein [Bradyrhizobium japonicum]MBR0730623.1 hypothetical protein [Bradyrhizobium japonicum]